MLLIRYTPIQNRKLSCFGSYDSNVKVKVLVAKSLFVTPWTITHQAPLSMSSPGKNTGVGCHLLLQGIFPIQGLNLALLYCRRMGQLFTV